LEVVGGRALGQSHFADGQLHGGVVQRFVFLVPDFDHQPDQGRIAVGAGFRGDGHARGHIGNQPADQLAPRLGQILLRRFIVHAPAPQISDIIAALRPNPKTLHRQRRKWLLLSSSETVASTLAPGLTPRTVLSTSRSCGMASRRSFSSDSVERRRVHGCSQPSRVRLNFHLDGSLAAAGDPDKRAAARR
jgi:hypothetical protein